MRYTKDLGKGVQMIRYTKESPFEKILSIGRDIGTRGILKADGAGVPKYSKAQKAKIKKDMRNYFNSIEKRYEK